MLFSWMHRPRTPPPDAGALVAGDGLPQGQSQVQGNGDGDGSAGAERRRHPRYPAVADQARVRWENDDGITEEPACLVDISRGGARLVADIPLPGGAALRITLDDTGDLPEVEASIVRVSECRGVGYLAQVKFLRPCPDAVFEQAIGGPERPEAAISETST